MLRVQLGDERIKGLCDIVGQGWKGPTQGISAQGQRCDDVFVCVCVCVWRGGTTVGKSWGSA